MRACHHRCLALAALAELGCGPMPSDAPPFAGTYAGVDVMKRCLRRDQPESSMTRQGIEDLEIVRLNDGSYHLTLPTLDCDISARIKGRRLSFQTQTCAANGRAQSEIQGSAQFDGDGLLELHLTAVEIWPPAPDSWPDGLWWDCQHDYLLERLE